MKNIFFKLTMIMALIFGFSNLALANLGDFAGGASLSLADYQFIGENADERAGYSVSSAGDVDGDGLGDLLIGAYSNDDGGSVAGKVYLIFGSSLNPSSPTVDLSNADYQFIGEDSGDNAGRSVSSAGDVDGDGLGDLLIGAYSNDDGGSVAGKVYLIFGSSLGSASTIDLSTADYQFIGENAGDQAGLSVTSAGDVDGDGRSDLLIGAWGNDDGGSYAGKAYLILGSSLGSSSTIDLSTADYQFIGENANELAGYSVSSAGDVDGDGKSDLLIGAVGNNDGGNGAGKAYLIFGSSLNSSSPTVDLSNADYQFIGEDGDWAGNSVSSAGDVDGDGRSDILIGAYGNDDEGPEAGKVYLILGSSLDPSFPTVDLLTADYQFIGENTYDEAGVSISSVGDVDGDGKSDLLIGADSNDDGGNRAGKAYLILAEDPCGDAGCGSYVESCDGVDNDGDGKIDEGFDGDGDGYTTCNSDCADSDGTINPGATEVCGDGVDQDCDSQDTACPDNGTDDTASDDTIDQDCDGNDDVCLQEDSPSENQSQTSDQSSADSSVDSGTSQDNLEFGNTLNGSGCSLNPTQSKSDLSVWLFILVMPFMISIYKTRNSIRRKRSGSD